MSDLFGVAQSYVTLKLPWARSTMLEGFIAWEVRTREQRIHEHGGWQDRLREWWESGRFDEKAGTIKLSTASEGRHLGDMTWIARQIVKKNKGGAQSHVHAVFVDTHPAFTGLPIEPRQKRKRRNP